MSTALEFPGLRQHPAAPLKKKRVAQAPPATQAPAVDEAEESSLFSREQIRQFREEDGAAMGTIAKIMTSLFAYTVVIMTVVTLWTISVVF